MDERARIEKIMESVNLSSGIFAGQIGIQNSTLSHILNNRNKPSLDVLKKILQRFPEISSDWLILGQGAMFREERKSQSPSLFDNNELILNKTDSYVDENIKKKNINEIPKENEVLKSEPNNKYGQGNTDRESSLTNVPFHLEAQNQQSHAMKSPIPKTEEKDTLRKVIKIILYYSDNTFQEVETK